uniref:Unannotated protein n=1 Tax=freshwater metagenome TaxID=449393 RepID=A0A6J5ZVK3_9ZZZZ
MVLDHVANRADGVIETSARLNAKVLGHRDLNLTNVVAVPDRLEECIGEAEEEDVLDRGLAQEMVDAEDPLLGEDGVKVVVQLLRRCEVAAERLLDNDPGLVGKPDVTEVPDDRTEERRRDRQVVNRTLGAAKLILELKEGLVLGVLAAGVSQQPAELLESRLVEAVRAGFKALLGALAKQVHVAALACHANHGHVEFAVDDHPLQGREDLLVGEVAGGAEYNQRVALLWLCHYLLPAGFSSWPPNSLRIADSSRFA